MWRTPWTCSVPTTSCSRPTSHTRPVSIRTAWAWRRPGSTSSARTFVGRCCRTTPPPCTGSRSDGDGDQDLAGRITTMEIRPIGTALGAEINGVELSEPLDEGALTAIHKAVIEHQVVVLRNVELSPDEHIRLGERFGEVEV